MYSIRYILNKEPVVLKAALVAVAAAVLGTWPSLELDGDVVLMWGVALELVLGLFVRSKSTPTATAEEDTENALAFQKNEIAAYLYSAPGASPERPLRAEGHSIRESTVRS